MLSWPVLPADSSSDPEALDRGRVHSADHLHHSEACFSSNQCRDTPAGTGERENEDDLPPDLAEAVGATTTPTTATTTATTTQVSMPLLSPKVHKISSPQNSEGKGQLSPGAKSPSNRRGAFTLEPGDLLMDFTEATPLVNFPFC